MITDWDGNAYYENRFDIGLQFGGGFSYSLGPGAILLDFRYGLGLIDIQKEMKSTNNVLAISAGYAFPLGSK
jgi:hypothetical protein